MSVHVPVMTVAGPGDHGSRSSSQGADLAIGSVHNTLSGLVRRWAAS